MSEVKPLAIRFSLATKGIIFVSVLLVVELSLLGAMTALLSQSEDELWKESHVNALISESDELIRTFYDAGTALIAFAATRSDIAAARFKQTLDKIPGQIETLHTLNSIGKDSDPAIARIEAMSERSLALLSRTNKFVDQSTAIGIILPDDGRREVKEQLAQLVDALGEFAERQRARKEQLSGRVQQTRLRVKQSIALTAAVNVIIAVLSVAWLMRTFSRRLDNIVGNTYRVKKREGLNAALPGTDEIALLDQVFHEMADGLEETARLKEEFLAVISHEIRSPITSISMLLEMIETGHIGKMTEWELERVRTAEHSARRVIELINSLLEMQKYDSGMMEMNFKSALIRPVVDRAARTVTPLAERKEITITIEKVAEEFFADPIRIEQVLINLIANAIKYSPSGSTITLRALSIEDHIEFQVEDNGPGIPAEKQPSLFEKYEQVEGNYDRNSSGLGLYICKSIIDAHQGKIGVRSELSKGSVFWFTIPR